MHDHAPRVTVVGAGYVGLATAACLAHAGVSVCVVDSNEARLGQLRTGRVPIYEPGLQQRVERATAAGRLAFQTTLDRTAARADVLFICVGTPVSPDGQVDVAAIFDVARALADVEVGMPVVVLKSSVPPGTAAAVQALLADAKRPLPVVSNPEFLREGSALHDFMHPDRLILGAEDQAAAQRVLALYRQVGVAAPHRVMSWASAELTKLAANAFLSVKLSFINEVAHLCERTGADVRDVATGVGLDPRIGSAHLQAGPGFGGSCLPKDGRALVRLAQDRGAPLGVVRAALEGNAQVQRRMVDVIVDTVGLVAGCTITVLGLAFKAGTDDVRESPALALALALQDRGARVQVFDPAAMANSRRVAPGLREHATPYDAVQGAHALVIATEWPMFRQLDWARVRRAVAQPVVIDLRGMLDADAMRRAHFRYVGIGRGGSA